MIFSGHSPLRCGYPMEGLGLDVYRCEMEDLGGSDSEVDETGEGGFEGGFEGRSYDADLYWMAYER